MRNSPPKNSTDTSGNVVPVMVVFPSCTVCASARCTGIMAMMANSARGARALNSENIVRLVYQLQCGNRRPGRGRTLRASSQRNNVRLILIGRQLHPPGPLAINKGQGHCNYHCARPVIRIDLIGACKVRKPYRKIMAKAISWLHCRLAL